MIFGIHAMSTDPTLLINEGAMHAIDEVKLRPGSLLQPNFPAPLNQRGLTMIRTQNVCAGLMNVASNGQSVASSNAYSISFYRGKEPKTGRPFHVSDGLGVGHGARPFADGHDCVYYVAQENNPAEFIDIEFPARLLRYAVRTDSGGPGKFRGGTGVVRETMWLGHDAILATRFDGVVNPPWGVNGGRSAEPGRCIVNPGTAKEREVKSLEDGVVVTKGDIIRFETGGGGGWGHPFDRDPERVLADVHGDYVSIEAARKDYGVVIDADKLIIDAEATEELRTRTRPESKLLHRRVYMDRME
jgi:N-methylhydantoinase B